MWFPKGDEEKEGIISTSKPVEYTGNKKIKLIRGVSPSEYDEIYDFIREQNRMSSGNFTLFPKSEIDKFMKMNALAVLMRSENNNSLIGTIFSIPFPVRSSVTELHRSPSSDLNVNSESLHQSNNNVIMHGCTTFLNVHQKLRNHGLCMALIRELTLYGFDKNYLCSYFLTDFQLSPNSISINSWYRPLNLPRAIGLGFGYPNWNVPSEFQQNRIKYSTKMPKKTTDSKQIKCKLVTSGKSQAAHNFLMSQIQNKKFAFSPDLKYFSKWIQEYPTYLVSVENESIGIFSLTSVFCRMETGLDGILALPLLFISKDNDTVFKCLISVAAERGFDVLYNYEVGDLTEEILNQNHCIKNNRPSYFSLYNNSIRLVPQDLFVPIF